MDSIENFLLTAYLQSCRCRGCKDYTTWRQQCKSHSGDNPSTNTAPRDRSTKKRGPSKPQMRE